MISNAIPGVGAVAVY